MIKIQFRYNKININNKMIAVNAVVAAVVVIVVIKMNKQLKLLLIIKMHNKIQMLINFDLKELKQQKIFCIKLYLRKKIE